MRRRQIWAMRAKEATPLTAIFEGGENAQQAIEDYQYAEVTKYLCPKCGKEFRRGLHLHVKHCKG